MWADARPSIELLAVQYTLLKFRHEYGLILGRQDLPGSIIRAPGRGQGGNGIG